MYVCVCESFLKPAYKVWETAELGTRLRQNFFGQDAITLIDQQYVKYIAYWHAHALWSEKTFIYIQDILDFSAFSDAVITGSKSARAWKNRAVFGQEMSTVIILVLYWHVVDRKLLSLLSVYVLVY